MPTSLNKKPNISICFTNLVPNYKHPLKKSHVPKYKSLYILLGAFIIIFSNITLINTTNLSSNMKSQIKYTYKQRAI